MRPPHIAQIWGPTIRKISIGRTRTTKSPSTSPRPRASTEDARSLAASKAAREYPPLPSPVLWHLHDRVALQGRVGRARVQHAGGEADAASEHRQRDAAVDHDAGGEARLRLGLQPLRLLAHRLGVGELLSQRGELGRHDADLRLHRPHLGQRAVSLGVALRPGGGGLGLGRAHLLEKSALLARGLAQRLGQLLGPLLRLLEAHLWV
mmetsp:Transcript_418/g.1223  ORF Transcript_418/g.1223 Transcript_418/m.1223 type:complete len:207 (+) Transcript_418:96-716(+)